MKEIDRMKERVYIDSILDKLSKDKQDKIIDVIKEFKTFIRTDEISLETLALLIFLNKD